MRDMLKDNPRILYYLILSNFLLYFGFRVWQSMFNNFAVEDLGVGAASIGVIQAVRELPGLMGFLIGFLALFLSEVRILSVSVIMLGAGLMLTGRSETVPALLVGTVVMSLGFHLFYPSNSGVVLMVTEKKQAPRLLGQLGSLGAIAAAVATGAVYFLADSWGYRTLFMVTGAIIIAGGLALLPMSNLKTDLPPKRRVIVRKKYWLYYALAFLMGSRRHIFTTFAIFLLVQKFGISVQTTALLFFVNNIANIFTMRIVGNMLGRWGERIMLTIAFTVLAFVFVGYAFVTLVPLLYVLFVLDNIMFGFNMSTSTYFQKIAVTKEEITSNLAVEQTINHIAAIIVPIVGGQVWEMFGSQVPFLAGAGIVLISLVLTQFIRVPKEPSEPAAVAA